MFRVRQGLSTARVTGRRAVRARAWAGAAPLLLLGSSAGAQVAAVDCGAELTPAEAMRAMALEAAGAYELPPGWGARAAGGRTRGVCSVPMTIHIVRRSDGTGGLEANWVQECISDATAHFAPIGVSFHQLGPTLYIDSDALYDINITDETNILRALLVVPGTINIYFVESATYCGISSFTFSPVQGIVINNGCTPRAGNHSTFSHEVAHYFDVFHTHERSFGIECPSGSNCQTAGDLVCDTPADPGLGGGAVSPECVYVGSAAPPCEEGIAFNPDPRNLMSYARHACRERFSAGQYERAVATLLNLRPELGCGAAPCPADWDGSDAVDSADIAAFLAAWLASMQDGTMAADFSADGVVDSNDISAFLTAWLAAVGGGC